MRILSQRDQFAWRLAYSFTPEEFARHTDFVDKTIDQALKNGVDIRSQNGAHVGGKWRFNPEYRAKRNQLMNDYYRQYALDKPQEGKGLIMGGIPASGKGTIQGHPDAQLDADNYFKLDPDDLKAKMIDRGMHLQLPGLSPMESSTLFHEESGDMAKELAKRAMKDKRNLLWDISMSSPGSVQGRIDDMRKHGYGQVDGAFVDADYDTSRQRQAHRYVKAEEGYRAGTNPHGGRWVPDSLSKSNAPTQPGYLSKNAETFDKIKGGFDNAIKFNTQGEQPVVDYTHGTRWHNHPLSTGGSTALPNVSTARRRRMASDEITLQSLVEAYDQGQIDFGQLLQAASEITETVEGPAQDVVEVHRRAEEDPDPNSFRWVEMAEMGGRLTPEQADQISSVLQ